MPISHRVRQQHPELFAKAIRLLEKLVTVPVTQPRRWAPEYGSLAAQGNMYPAWALLPREVPSAEQIRHERYWGTG